jgi:RNA polymerase sigma-70 factor (ECF subfamily)
MSSEANTGSSRPSEVSKELRIEELLSGVAEREVEALERLYDQFAPRLMGLLIRILSSRPDAESALQEVFLRLWKEAPGIAQTKGSVAAWLVFTARQVAFQRLRAQRAGAARPSRIPHRQGRRKGVKSVDKPTDSTSRAGKPAERLSARYDSQTAFFLASSPQLWLPRPEEVALVDARLGLLQRAFNQMPKPQRRALELAVFDAYTESEIAAQLGEPLGRVTAGLQAAFTFLRHRQQAVLGTWTADI